MSASTIRNTIAVAFFAASSLFVVQTASAAEKYMFVSTRHIPDSQVDARVQAATQACDPGSRRHYESAAFKKCMLRLGWRYSHVHRFAGANRRAQEEADLDKRNEDEANAAEQRRDEQMRNDESNRAMQMNQ
jgi:hypothetical protein